VTFVLDFVLTFAGKRVYTPVVRDLKGAVMPESFDDVRRGYYESRCETAVKALEKRWFDASWHSSATHAVKAILDLIPPGASIGAGGSVTLRETGLLESLEERGDTIVYHRSDMGFEESLEAHKKAVMCDYYLCSTNALTMDGELINTDGVCNRIAGMVFGPRTVVILAGVNKLVADREAGITRIREVAAPANARRLGIDVPCVEKGRCVDCRKPANICRATTIISLKPILTDMKIVLVAEPLGL
jgi:hypothetical protein